MEGGTAAPIVSCLKQQQGGQLSPLYGGCEDASDQSLGEERSDGGLVRLCGARVDLRRRNAAFGQKRRRGRGKGNLGVTFVIGSVASRLKMWGFEARGMG